MIARSYMLSHSYSLRDGWRYVALYLCLVNDFSGVCYESYVSHKSGLREPTQQTSNLYSPVNLFGNSQQKSKRLLEMQVAYQHFYARLSTTLVFLNGSMHPNIEPIKQT
jgi:hypothetical protein